MDDIRNLMFKSLDNELDNSDNQKLNNALQHSNSLKTEFSDYKKIRNSLEEFDANFSQDFSKRLFDRIKYAKTDLWRIFKKVAISSAAAILLLLLSIYIMDGSINLDAIFGLHLYSVENEFYSYLNI